MIHFGDSPSFRLRLLIERLAAVPVAVIAMTILGLFVAVSIIPAMIMFSLSPGDPPNSSWSKIYRPPCSRLAAFFNIALPRKTYERIIVQMLADGREEYYEALFRGDLGVAKIIAGRTWIFMVLAVIGAACEGAISKLFPRPPAL